MLSGRFWSRCCRPHRMLGDRANGRSGELSRRSCICCAVAALADAAALLPSGFNRAALVLPLARQRVVADDQPHPADGDTRGARSRGIAQCWGDRQYACGENRLQSLPMAPKSPAKVCLSSFTQVCFELCQRPFQVWGGQVELRWMRTLSRQRSGGTSPCIAAAAAAIPKLFKGCLIVVNDGQHVRAAGMSSKPATERP